MRLRKKKKLAVKFDTSLEGYKYLGINLTEEQYKDLCDINFLVTSDIVNKNQIIPVHYILLVLKTLGLLPTENVNQVSHNDAASYTREEYKQFFQSKYGKLKE